MLENFVIDHFLSAYNKDKLVWVLFSEEPSDHFGLRYRGWDSRREVLGQARSHRKSRGLKLCAFSFSPRGEYRVLPQLDGGESRGLISSLVLQSLIATRNPDRFSDP